MTELLRLSKRLSEMGLCSRREADIYIQRGLVQVDGKTVQELGFKVRRDQQIELLAAAQKAQNSRVTILLNKPVGCVSGQPEDNLIPAVRLIQDENRFGKGSSLRKDFFDGLAPAGRLDYDSEGLLVFTQDGRIAKQLIGEDSQVEKEYEVQVQGVITSEKIQKLGFGLSLDEKPLKKAIVEKLSQNTLKFILKEGKKRQIRRMCQLVDLKVETLKRVRIGNVILGHLPIGQWRYLETNENFLSTQETTLC